MRPCVRDQSLQTTREAPLELNLERVVVRGRRVVYETSREDVWVGGRRAGVGCGLEDGSGT